VFAVFARPFRYVPFDELNDDSMFGEAPVLLNTWHLVTTVATEATELFFIPKGALENGEDLH